MVRAPSSTSNAHGRPQNAVQRLCSVHYRTSTYYSSLIIHSTLSAHSEIDIAPRISSLSNLPYCPNSILAAKSTFPPQASNNWTACCLDAPRLISVSTWLSGYLAPVLAGPPAGAAPRVCPPPGKFDREPGFCGVDDPPLGDDEEPEDVETG